MKLCEELDSKCTAMSGPSLGTSDLPLPALQPFSVPSLKEAKEMVQV